MAYPITKVRLSHPINLSLINVLKNLGKVVKLSERILSGKTKADIRQMEEEHDGENKNSDNRR